MKLEDKTFTLYHGTSSKNVSSIVEYGFIKKPNQEDWLGHGVYFFTYGITCPKDNALQWSKNNNMQNISYKASVLKTKITVSNDKLLDLTTLEGLQLYNTTRDRIVKNNTNNLQNRRDLKIKKRKDFRVDDQVIMNLVIDKLKIQVVISHLYIKNKNQRLLELESSLPNSTVVSVINTSLLTQSRIQKI